MLHGKLIRISVADGHGTYRVHDEGARMNGVPMVRLDYEPQTVGTDRHVWSEASFDVGYQDALLGESCWVSHENVERMLNRPLAHLVHG